MIELKEFSKIFAIDQLLFHLYVLANAYLVQMNIW